MTYNMTTGETIWKHFSKKRRRQLNAAAQEFMKEFSPSRDNRKVLLDIAKTHGVDKHFLKRHLARFHSVVINNI